MSHISCLFLWDLKKRETKSRTPILCLCPNLKCFFYLCTWMSRLRFLCLNRFCFWKPKHLIVSECSPHIWNIKDKMFFIVFYSLGTHLFFIQSSYNSPSFWTVFHWTLSCLKNICIYIYINVLNIWFNVGAVYVLLDVQCKMTVTDSFLT